MWFFNSLLLPLPYVDYRNDDDDDDDDDNHDGNDNGQDVVNDDNAFLPAAGWDVLYNFQS